MRSVTLPRRALLGLLPALLLAGWAGHAPAEKESNNSGAQHSANDAG